jgi:hypothetical protein
MGPHEPPVGGYGGGRHTAWLPGSPGRLPQLQRRAGWLDLITRVVHTGCDRKHIPSVTAVLSEQVPGAYTPTGGQCPVRGGWPTRSVLDVEWRTVHPTRPLSTEQ